MYKIKPTIFNITEEEIRGTVDEMIAEEILETDLKLSKKQIAKILTCVECDEFLANNIRTSIRSSILEIVDGRRMIS